MRIPNSFLSFSVTQYENIYPKFEIEELFPQIENIEINSSFFS